MPILSTVQATVAEAMKAYPSQVAAAKHCGVHRNFLIDLLRGRVPTVRNGHKLADEDPRYTSLATGLGLDASAFISLAKKEQQSLVRATSKTPETETGVGRTRHGGIVINLAPQMLAMPNVSLAFDIPEGRVTISISPHTKP